MDTLLSIQIRVIKAQAEAQIKGLQGDLRSLQTQLRTAGSANFLDATSKSATNLSLSLRSAAYALMTTFTGPVIGAGKQLLQSYMDNQKAVADLAKVYGTDPFKNYTDDLAQLQDAFKALSNEFGVNQDEVTGIAASWAAAGVQGEALAESVQNTLKAMVIGDMSASDATNALIAIQASYGASSQDLTGILNDLNAVENQTGITMEGLIQGFQRSASSAAGAGIDVRHLAADLAAITPAAGTATQAGNALKTIIDKILVSSSAASPLLKQMGIDVNSAGWTALTAQQRLEKLAVAFSGLTQQQKAQVSTTVANLYQINRFDQLMQDMANYLNGTADATSYYGKALDATSSPTKAAQIAQKELNTVLDSQPQLMAEVGTALKNQLMDTIKPLIPMILSMADALLQFAQWFGKLNPNIQKFVGIAILALAVLGPVLLYVSALGSAFHYFGEVVGVIFKPFSLLMGLFGGGAAKDIESTSAALGKLDDALKANAGQETATASEAIKASKLATAQINADTAERRAARLAERESMLQEAADARLAAAGVVEASQTAAAGVSAGAAEVVQAQELNAAVIAATAEEIMATLLTSSVDIQSVWTGMMANLNVITTAGWTDLQAVWDAELASINISTESAMLGITQAVDAGMIEVSGGIMAGARDLQVIWDEAMAEQLRATAEAQSAVTEVIEAAMIADTANIMEGSRNLVLIWGTAMAEMTEETAVAMEASTAVMAGGMAEQAGVAAAGSTGILSKMMGGLAGLPGMLGKFLISPWGLAIAAVVGLLLLFPDQVKAVFNYVVKIVEQAAKAVYNWFQYINPFAHHSPSLVDNVVQGMAIVGAAFATVTDIQAPVLAAYNTVKQFGEAVAGLAVTARNIDFAKGLKSLTDSGGSSAAIALYKQLYTELDQLNAKASDLNDVIQQQQVVVDQDKAALDGANASLDAQNNILNSLTKTQSYWDNLVNQTTTDISNLSNTGIVGQQAMSDQIFANTQAQKALQLQMMQMEDVNGPIDDATASLAALQGQIESLQGEQKSLRQAGAGSEITGSIQSQINGLMAQQATTQGSVAAYDALNTQLTELQRKGQELDLENSLDFDGLTRQIQQAASAMTELPFDQILAGIEQDQAALHGYTSQYNAATDAVNAQQTAVDNATAQRDALQAVYDTENAKLQTLQDSYGKVNDAIQAINSSLQTMTDNASKASDAASAASGGLNPNDSFDSANLGNSLDTSDSLDGLKALTDQAIKDTQDRMGKLDMLGPVKNAWKKVTAWAKTNLGGNSEFGQDVSDFVSGTQAKLASIDWSKMGSDLAKSPFVKTLQDMGSTVGNLYESLGQLISPDVILFFKNLTKGAQDFWNEIEPKLMPLIAAMGRAWSDLWVIVKPFYEFFGITLLGAFKLLSSIIAHTVGPAIKLFGDQIGQVIKIVTDVLNLLDDLFHGRWKQVWDDLVKIAKDTVTGIWQALTDGWNLILATVEGFVDGIVGFFEWLYDELVGHSIVPDMINAIVGWFLGLPGMIFGAIESLVSDIATFFINVMNSALTGIVTGWQAVAGWFAGLPGVIAGYFSGALGWLSNAGYAVLNGFWNGLMAFWGNIVGFLGGMGGTIMSWFGGAIGWLSGAGHDILQGLFNGLGAAINAAGGAVASMAGNLANGIRTALDNVLNLPWHIPTISLGWGISIGGQTLIPRFAKGGIFDKATQAIIGEAGAEAVIPLTNAPRAWDIVKASGLLNVIAPYMTTALANGFTAPNTAWARAESSQAGQNNAPTISYADNGTTATYNFYGDLKFPNVKSGDDVEDFLKNLEVLARKG